MFKKLFLMVLCSLCVQSYPLPVYGMALPSNMKSFFTMIKNYGSELSRPFFDFFQKKRQPCNHQPEDLEKPLPILKDDAEGLELKKQKLCEKKTGWEKIPSTKTVLESDNFTKILSFLDVSESLNLRLCNKTLKKAVDENDCLFKFRWNFPLGLRSAAFREGCNYRQVPPSQYLFPLSYYSYTLKQDNLFFGPVFTFLKDLLRAENLKEFSKSKLLNVRPYILLLDDKTISFLDAQDSNWSEKIGKLNIFFIAKGKNALRLILEKNLYYNILCLSPDCDTITRTLYEIELKKRAMRQLKKEKEEAEEQESGSLSKKTNLKIDLDLPLRKKYNKSFCDVVLVFDWKQIAYDRDFDKVKFSYLKNIKKMIVTVEGYMVQPNYEVFLQAVNFMPQLESLSFQKERFSSPQEIDFLYNVLRQLPNLQNLELPEILLSPVVLEVLVQTNPKLSTLTISSDCSEALMGNAELFGGVLEFFILKSQKCTVNFTGPNDAPSVFSLVQGMKSRPHLVSQLADLFRLQPTWTDFSLTPSTKDELKAWAVFLARVPHLNSLTLGLSCLSQWQFGTLDLPGIRAHLSSFDFFYQLKHHCGIQNLEINDQCLHEGYRQIFFETLFDNLPSSLRTLTIRNSPKSFCFQDGIASLIYKTMLDRKKIETKIFYQ
jgi:hypothetical protein